MPLKLKSYRAKVKGSDELRTFHWEDELDWIKKSEQLQNWKRDVV